MPNLLSGAARLGRCCLVSLVCLLTIALGGQGASAEADPNDRLSVDPAFVSRYGSMGSYSLLHSECESELASTEGLLSLPDPPSSLMCGRARAAVTQGASADESAQEELFPALEWKPVQETVHLRPTAGAAVGINWFGTFDGEISVLNLPIVGTALLSMSSGSINFGSAVGLGLGGLYVQFGLELPLYYKYPHFWSLNFILGSIYNLGFFLNETWESTGIWGGGPKFILELGVLRITTTFAVGYAGRYCGSFLCDAGVGTSISLNLAFIEETTGLPRQQ
jgi:hypothetical protein